MTNERRRDKQSCAGHLCKRTKSREETRGYGDVSTAPARVAKRLEFRSASTALWLLSAFSADSESLPQHGKRRLTAA